MVLKSMRLDEIIYGVSITEKRKSPRKGIQEGRLEEASSEIENQENVVSWKPSKEIA